MFAVHEFIDKHAMEIFTNEHKIGAHGDQSQSWETLLLLLLQPDQKQ